MLVLHTADLHLGKILHEQSLLEDQRFVLDQLADELASRPYDLFVVAGDIFDRSVPPPEAVVLWDDFLVDVTARCPGLTVVVVSGNHDGAQRLSYLTRFLQDRRIHLRTRPEDLDRPVELSVGGRDWQIFAVPFLAAGSLGAVRDGAEAVLRSQRELWTEALERIGRARKPGVPAMLVTHLFTQGGSESESERLFVGEAEQIPASLLAGWDYVALGHLHRCQEPAPGVRYSGSPLAYSFSEAGDTKVALRWDDGVVTPVPLKPYKPVTRLEGRYDDFAVGEAYAAYRDHWLEITLTDPALVPGPLDRLRPRFPGLLSLVQAPVRTAGSTEGPAPADRRSGDAAADALQFLAEVGAEVPEGAGELLTAAVREVSHETA